MKKDKLMKQAFIMVGVLLIEVMGLVQGIFSAQSIKHNLEVRVEQNSQMMLEQFVKSYEVTTSLQEGVGKLTEEQMSTAMVKRFSELQQVIAHKKNLSREMVYGDGEIYRLEVLPNNEATKTLYLERYGINLAQDKAYQMVSYTMKRNEQNMSEVHVIIGPSLDKKWVINLAINEKLYNSRLENTQRKLSNLLNSEYYFSDNTGNFYVFTASGKVIYQGGFEKNANYFTNMDLNSSLKVIDLIRKQENQYLRVIYPAEHGTKRSLMKTHFDSTKDLYFVYETDQTKAFEPADKIFRLIWVVGIGIILSTVIGLNLLWRVRVSLEETL